LIDSSEAVLTKGDWTLNDAQIVSIGSIISNIFNVSNAAKKLTVAKTKIFPMVTSTGSRESVVPRAVRLSDELSSIAACCFKFVIDNSILSMGGLSMKLN
jgi:hypothetical protein